MLSGGHHQSLLGFLLDSEILYVFCVLMCTLWTNDALLEVHIDLLHRHIGIYNR